MRRLLKHSPDTAGGLMTSEPVVLTPDTTVAEALARVRDPDLTAALASMVFVARPPTATPTGRYLGCVHLQRLLREPPAELVGGIVDTDLLSLTPETPLAAGDPLLRRLQPGVRAGGRRPEPPAGRGDRRRPARSPAAARLARSDVPAARRPPSRVDATTAEDAVMSDSAAPRRLYTPRDIAPVLAAAGPRGRRSGSPSPSRATSVPAATCCCRRSWWWCGFWLNLFAVSLALGPVPVHPPQPGLLHPGRLRGSADPAGPEPAGEPGPGHAGGGSPPRRADQGRHRVPGPRAGRAAAGRRRGRRLATTCATSWKICATLLTDRSPQRRETPTRRTATGRERSGPQKSQLTELSSHCATPVTRVMYGDLVHEA